MNQTQNKKRTILAVIAILIVLLSSILLAIFVIAPRWAEQMAEARIQAYLQDYPDAPASTDTIILRGEFAALLAYDMKLEDFDSKANGYFDDTHGHWAEPFIEALVDHDVLTGGGEFFPDQPISRIECIRMIVRSIGKEQEAKNSGWRTSFDDNDAIGIADKGFVNVAEKYRITHGFTDNLVRPSDDTTWAEAIEMLLHRAAAHRIDEQESHEDETASDKPGIDPDSHKQTGVGKDKPANPGPSVIPPAPIPSQPEPGVLDPDAAPIPDPSQPNQPSGGSGSSGGSSAAQVDLQLPDYSYTDQSFVVKAVSRNTRSIAWELTDADGVPLLSDHYSMDLSKDGGLIHVFQPGMVYLTATAKNYSGRTYTFTKDIVIYPVMQITVNTPDYVHTDKPFSVTTTLSENVTQQLNWHVYLDGKEVVWQEHVEGTLDNSGGSIRLRKAGNYTFKAVAYDITSRAYYGAAKLISLPVVGLDLDIPSNTHTDTGVNVALQTTNLGDLNVKWTLLHDKEAMDLAEASEHELSNEGGFLRILKKGSYELCAEVVDPSGRTFSQSAPITVYPVASIDFTLPELAHTDGLVNIQTLIMEQQGNTVAWTISKEGTPIEMKAAVEGPLSDTGGQIRFKEPGLYRLTATLTDLTGREFAHSESITIYPVVELGFYLPEMLHPDETAVVEAKFTATDGLQVVWTLNRDGSPVQFSDYIDGELSDNGGQIRFTKTGNYMLRVSTTDAAGRSFTSEQAVIVLPVITLDIHAPAYTHTDIPADVVLTATDRGELPVVWNITPALGGEAVPNVLGSEGGTLPITEKGVYIVKAAITDQAGRTFTSTHSIQVYPVPTMPINLPEAVHTDNAIHLDIPCTDMDGLTAEWHVDNTYGFQNWDTYVDGVLHNHGGLIRFRRAGVYDLQARVTDETGRVFLFNSSKIEVLPVLSLTFSLPETSHTDTEIDLRTRGNIGVLPIEWTLMKNGSTIPLASAIDGTLNAQGGKIRFVDPGDYRLTATMFDALGRIFTHSQTIKVYSLLNCSFTMPQQIHAGQEFAITPASDSNCGGLPVSWTLQKDGAAASVADYLRGSVGDGGGIVHIDHVGNYLLKAEITDEAGRSFSSTQPVSVTNQPPALPSLTIQQTRTYQNGKFYVQISAAGSDPDGDPLTYEFEGRTADGYYGLGNHTVRVRAKDPYGGVSGWKSAVFQITNTAPTKPGLTASVTRTSKNGSFLVNFTLTPSSDPDGDPITYEYENKQAYYALGTHTVRVRASDARGGISDWAEATFTVSNAPPSRPVITRTPDGNSVPPGTPVTLRAVSTDADGDPVTYVWEGRTAETAVYPLGKHTVRVKAVDSHGAESAWTAVVFFVMDSNGTGGMMLSGPSSTILEEGIDGATITEYTFTVPPVSGHNGDDYGRVRGYNVKTKQWDELDYGTTNNGITFTRTLSAGIYSKLEMYYYTNHDCMYNKSNITYSVNYYFE